MRDFRDFDARMERMQRAHRRFNAFVGIFSLILFAAFIAAGVAFVMHPEAVGGFFGRIVAGFEARR